LQTEWAITLAEKWYDESRPSGLRTTLNGTTKDAAHMIDSSNLKRLWVNHVTEG